jgi:hypothetical protein
MKGTNVNTFKRGAVRAGLVSLLALDLTLLLASCGVGKVSEPFRDAQRGGTNSAPMDVIEMSDGFSNVGTKCDHGNRVYVIFKGDQPYGSLSVVAKDETCR